MEKNAGGRPLKFATPADLENKIQEYFESCWEELCDEGEDDDGNAFWKPRVGRDGQIVKWHKRPYTISGLADYLDVDRKTLLNYENRDGFFHTIKKAKTKIENFTEEQLFNKQAKNMVGIIFNLKNNYGWQDRTEMDMQLSGAVQVLDDLNEDDIE